MAHAGGRPTDYTPELADKICGYIATSAVGITQICATHDDIPSKDTIFKWIHKYTEFSDQYLAAKEKQALAITEMLSDDIDAVDERPEAIAKQTLRFRYYQWQLSKLAPKQFGDKKETKTEINLNVHEDQLKQLK